jgi:hypothetical protein
MNRTGAVGPIGFIFLFIMFVIIWFVWAGGWVADVGHGVVTQNGLTGVEAFFFDNLNVVIMIGAVLGVLGYMAFGGLR